MKDNLRFGQVFVDSKTTDTGRLNPNKYLGCGYEVLCLVEIMVEKRKTWTRDS